MPTTYVVSPNASGNRRRRTGRGGSSRTGPGANRRPRTAGGKRTRARSYTRTDVKRKRKETPLQTMQMAQSSYQYGKAKTLRQLMPAMALASMNRAVWLFRHYKAFNDSGAKQAFNYLAAAGGLYHTPMYVIDLLHRPTTIHASHTGCMRRCVMDTAPGTTDGQLYWINETGLDYNGNLVSNSPWQIQHGSTGINGPSTLGATATPRTLVRWINLKANCWGAKYRATKWSIQIISLKDDVLDPWQSSGQTSVKHQVCWQSMLKQFTANPIAQTHNPHQRDMKVLKEVSFILAPNDASDGDPDGAVRTVNMFLRLDKLCDYVQNYNVPISSTDDVQYTTPAELPQQRTIADRVDTKRKLIAVIRCSDYLSTSAAFDVNLHGSFDISVRRAEDTDDTV